ncbi:J domain-containing protein [Meloidogyne graminicola]|uniref:J domain-containing protein n=1 Tax=Meloidogyne graminicola TaxID=189291 RepID=A0A8S9ZT72_9BILA|nr:J domain-containing protein [Meloidogyne graminicola]
MNNKNNNYNNKFTSNGDEKNKNNGSDNNNWSEKIIADCFYSILGVKKMQMKQKLKKLIDVLRLNGILIKIQKRKNAQNVILKELLKAYEVLSDGKRRAEYDKHGLTKGTSNNNHYYYYQNSNPRRRTTPEFSAHHHFFPNGGFRSPFDVFREFFGDPFGSDPFNSPLFAFGRENSAHSAGMRR